MSRSVPIQTMTQAECWAMLGRQQVGRLGVDVGGQPDIFPVNYVVDAETIVFKSAPGTKLAAAVLGSSVAFEIDGDERDDRSVWSVVVKGTAYELDGTFERFEVEDLPLYPWVAGEKRYYVQIVPSLVTGRRFHVLDGRVQSEVTEPLRTARPSPPSS